MRLYTHALTFATAAHGDQKRKYTFEPYINHPVAVAGILYNNNAPEYVLAAALLHDVLEDTDTTADEMRAVFGDTITDLVLEVTDVAKPSDGNRKARMAINARHLAKASYWAQTIKFADFIHNGEDIAKNAPGFFKVYRVEKNEALALMCGGDRVLWKIATELYDLKQYVTCKGR